MSQDVPERLVINLLALAEAGPDLPPEARERLAMLASKVDADANALARVSLEMHTVLRCQSAFTRAKAAWDVERSRLDTRPIDELLTNPLPYPAMSTVECAATVAREALECPEALSSHPEVLRWLAGLLWRRWPRED